jgi:hypothetical protein
MPSTCHKGGNERQTRAAQSCLRVGTFRKFWSGVLFDQCSRTACLLAEGWAAVPSIIAVSSMILALLYVSGDKRKYGDIGLC